ncbi:unnamed protein product [Sphagnum troendelagicum]|uniref:Uncharacterized protein n=1 Tax=Sphagnum troendelagicum TaxID=128251 RepID=A0ABP0UKA4_9BRYO
MATTQVSTLTVSTRLGAVLLKFATNEDRQAALQGHKGLAGTKLGLDENFMPTQHARKSELRPLFQEAKAASKRAFWRAAEFFVDDIQICPPSSI